jgi:hypothetical protein
MSNQISIGSKVKTAKGTEGKIAQILEGGYLLDTGQRIRVESIALVLPPPEPTGIEIGDRLRRNAQPQTKYPSKWFVDELDDRPRTVPPIESAIVERFSTEGYWVITPDDRLFHVPESAIEEGTWQLINN